MKTKFTFSLWPCVVVIVLLVTMINLGFWQLRRFEYKKTLLASYQAGLVAQPIDWGEFLKVTNKQFHRVTVRGHYLNDKTVLLDNRWHNDRLGFEVLTPFKPQGQTTTLLVNRGWVPMRGSRRQLPDLQPVVGTLTLQGYVYHPNKKSFMLGSNIEPSTRRVPLIQQVNVTDVSRITGLTFYPFILRLTKHSPSGFIREWSLVTVMPQKHLGYAVQWFAMSFALVIAFLMFARRAKAKKEN